MASVKLNKVTKRFGDKEAVSELTFEVRDKEFFVIAGPPGVGKTTTLRLISGLTKLDSGEIYIGDELVNAVHPRKRDVAMVFENLAVYPHKTGYDNIAFPLRQRKLPVEEVSKRVSDVASLLRIQHLLDRLPHTYSGGELQRLALARAIIRRPKVYLMDQPLANLDALIRANMRAELKRLVRDIGQTIIYTTHDYVEALAMGDRVAAMTDGKFVQCDAPDIIFNRPKNKFVASFFGSPPMNFFDVSYTTKNGRASLVHGELTVDITEQKHLVEKLATGSELILGVRAEHISLSKKPTPAVNATAMVRVTEPLGSKSIVTLTLTDTDEPLKVIQPAGLTFDLGEKVWLQIEKESICLFDKKSEEAIV